MSDDVIKLLNTATQPPEYYTQYPGGQPPAVLWGGTWELAFAGEGVFFRTEGDGADVFEGDIQLDQMQQITGQLNVLGLRHANRGLAIGVSGAFSYGRNFNRYSTAQAFGGNGGVEVLFDNTNSPGVRVGVENRPRNRTVRVWRRLSN